jgi:3-oxoacyl-[acyl-carrier protein] reductase
VEKLLDRKKTIFVTGTSKGLGFSIATSLLKAGYVVVGINRSKTAIEHSNFFYESFDLNDTKSIYPFITTLIEKYGIPYGLINNAGIGNGGTLGTQHEKDITKLININLLAPILFSKYITRKMLLKREGKIINIASIIGTTGFNGLSVYGATKSGLIGFTKSLSREVGKMGIIVNSVSPGYLETEMTEGIDNKNKSKILNRSPFKKLAAVEDVSDLVLYLISKGSWSIHGQNLIVDGGSTA